MLHIILSEFIYLSLLQQGATTNCHKHLLKEKEYWAVIILSWLNSFSPVSVWIYLFVAVVSMVFLKFYFFLLHRNLNPGNLSHPKDISK